MVDSSRITTSWNAEDQPTSAGFQRPEYHITRDVNGPVTEIKSGDTIWLIGQLYSPWGKLPPSIDARIDVAESTEYTIGTAGHQCTQESSTGNLAHGYRFRAAETSRWFLLADVSELFPQLNTLQRNGTVAFLQKRPGQPIGQSLRRIRKLDSAEPC